MDITAVLRSVLSAKAAPLSATICGHKTRIGRYPGLDRCPLQSWVWERKSPWPNGCIPPGSRRARPSRPFDGRDAGVVELRQRLGFPIEPCFSRSGVASPTPRVKRGNREIDKATDRGSGRRRALPNPIRKSSGPLHRTVRALEFEHGERAARRILVYDGAALGNGAPSSRASKRNPGYASQ